MLFWTALSLFIATSLFMIMLVLAQKGGGGLIGMLAGGGREVIGANAPSVVMRLTCITFGAFIALAVAVSLLMPLAA